MPQIQDIVNCRGKYKHFTKIDLSMFSYYFELDGKSKEFCTINTLYNLFCYTQITMGVKVPPDVVEAMIKKILAGLDYAAYINDCGI